MTTNPFPDPAPRADAAEQDRATGPGADADALREEQRDLPPDAPAADVAEQSVPVGPAGGRLPADPPLEADAADAAEQSYVVPLDEDEGRDGAG